MKDPVQCCQLAGVQPPTSAWQQCGGESTIPRLLEVQEGDITDKDKEEQTEEIIVSV